MEISHMLLGNGANVIIRPGEQRDVIPYLTACQQAAEVAYRDPRSTFNLFTPEHYFYPSTMDYWLKMTKNDEHNRWWVAEVAAKDGAVIGGVGLKSSSTPAEGWGLYVLPEWQGMGIGSELIKVRQSIFKGPLLFEVYAHAADTIAFHERKGAVKTGNQRLIHWDSWPDDVNLTALEFISHG